MSILSDRQIRDLCLPPTHWVQYITGNGTVITSKGIRATKEEINSLIRDKVISSEVYDINPHTIDNFKPMLDPFVAGQVREEYPPEVQKALKFMEDDIAEKRKAMGTKPFHDVGRIELDIQRTEEMIREIHSGGEKKKVISYGLSSYGYDVRIAPEFKIFTNVNSTVIDPLDFDERAFVDFEGDCCIIPPNSFVLARSVEYFRMPKDVTGIVLAKSTYARTGMSCLATPLEAGWEGHVTLEYANNTPLPMKLYANQGAAQVLFFKGEACMTSYADRGGKYQGQTGITLPKG